MPMEEVVEVKRGKKVNAERKFFPGYVLVKMELNDETWHLVRNTAKVTGFLGGGGKPTPIPDAEAERILHQMQEGIEHPRPLVTFMTGDQVRVIDGPFSSFNGNGRGGRRGQGSPQGRGLDLRPRDAGRARVLAGREAVAQSGTMRERRRASGPTDRRGAVEARKKWSMAKKIVGYVKLQVPAGKANPSPPIGPALGQRGLNIMEFCKAFNAATQGLEPGMPIPVVITAFADRTFTFTTKTPPASYLLKRAAGLDKGNATPGRATSGKVTLRQLREIAEQKMQDLNANDLDAAVEHDRGLGPVDGPRGGGVGRWPARASGCAPPRRRSIASKAYPLDEAVALVKQSATAKFDETIEVALNLGVDPRHADQMVRGTVDLPHGTGKSMRVAVFARGDKAEEAKAAGADMVGAEDLAEAIQGGEIDFDRCIATPDMMPVVGRLGRILGPRGLMPNPKLGTVTPNVGQAVRAAKAGQVQFRVEKTGIVHAGVGKASFAHALLVDNIKAFVDAVNRAKPTRRQGHLHEARGDQLDHGPGGAGRGRQPGRADARQSGLAEKCLHLRGGCLCCAACSMRVECEEPTAGGRVPRAGFRAPGAG